MTLFNELYFINGKQVFVSIYDDSGYTLTIDVHDGPKKTKFTFYQEQLDNYGVTIDHNNIIHIAMDTINIGVNVKKHQIYVFVPNEAAGNTVYYMYNINGQIINFNHPELPTNEFDPSYDADEEDNGSEDHEIPDDISEIVDTLSLVNLPDLNFTHEAPANCLGRLTSFKY